MFIILYRPEVQKGREKCELTLKKGIRLRINFVLWLLLKMYYDFFQKYRKIKRLKQ